MELEHFIIKVLHKLKSYFLETGLFKGNLKDRKLGQELKQKVVNLGSLQTELQMEPAWVEYRKSVRQDIIQKNPQNFLNWPAIRSSMFHEPDPVELNYLKSSADWLKFKSILKEVPVGSPRPFPGFLSSSGNYIHNAYILTRFLNFFNFDIAKAHNIVEFGGGYGSLCRLAYNLGFAGQYVIYDLPEFSLLQEYFLKSWRENFLVSLRPVAKNRASGILLSGLEDLQQQLKNFKADPDIFIADWSLSESPVELREKIFGLVGQSRYIFIAFRDIFSSVNNLDYFKHFKEFKPNYVWRQEELRHLPGNFLLAGKRKGI